MKLIYLSALDAKVVGKTGSLVRSKVLQNGGEYSKSFLFEQCSRDKAKLRAAVILLENEPDKENEDITFFFDSETLVYDWNLVFQNDWMGVRNAKEWRRFFKATLNLRILPKVRDMGVLSGIMRSEMYEGIGLMRDYVEARSE